MNNYTRTTIQDTIAVSQARTLKNRGYKILSKINEGSFAKVYLGEFVSPEYAISKLAVKILDVRRKPRDSFQKFLPRELNILVQIDHPHIIHIHSILQIGKKIYIFMRYAEQGDLLEFLLKNGAINEFQARVWIRQIALAVQYLHELNIAHRDLKCENILVTKNFNVKLSDFGFSRCTVDKKEKPVLSDTYCGTLSYASPEILNGRPYNPKIADLWSLGVVLFVMLNKRLPFPDSNAKLLYEKQITRKYKFRSAVVDGLSEEVKLLIDQLLEPDATKRLLIEKVINSDWIRMDVRLLELSNDELKALTFAAEHHVFENEIIALPYFKYKKKQQFVQDNEPQLAKVGVIKPYSDDSKPRKSQNNHEMFPSVSFNNSQLIEML